MIHATYDGLCRCGAEVLAGDRVQWEPGMGITGCVACDWTGERRRTVDVHRGEIVISQTHGRRALSGPEMWAMHVSGELARLLGCRGAAR